MYCFTPSLQIKLLERPTTRTVGDDAGWNFAIQSWPKGKQFLVDDILGKVLHIYIFEINSKAELHTSYSGLTHFYN